MKAQIETLLEIRKGFIHNFNWGEWSGPQAAYYWNIILLITARIEELNYQVMRQHAYFS
jgi:hypothetical protein